MGRHARPSPTWRVGSTDVIDSYEQDSSAVTGHQNHTQNNMRLIYGERSPSESKVRSSPLVRSTLPYMTSAVICVSHQCFREMPRTPSSVCRLFVRTAIRNDSKDGGWSTNCGWHFGIDVIGHLPLVCGPANSVFTVTFALKVCQKQVRMQATRYSHDHVYFPPWQRVYM